MIHPDFLPQARALCIAAVAALIVSTAVQLLPDVMIFLRFGPME